MVNFLYALSSLFNICFVNQNGLFYVIYLGDEEPNSPNNPYQDQNGFLGSSYKGRIVPGKMSFHQILVEIYNI